MKKLVVVLAVLALSATFAFATGTANQTIGLAVDNISVLAAPFTTGLSLKLIAPTLGGGTEIPAVSTAANAAALNYTSVITGTTKKTITAALDVENLPAGTKLTIAPTTTFVAGSEATTGSMFGTPATKTFVYSTTTGYGAAQTIVSAIPSCVTGTGQSAGMTLIYTLAVNDVSQLVSHTSSNTVIDFTLSD